MSIHSQDEESYTCIIFSYYSLFFKGRSLNDTVVFKVNWSKKCIKDMHVVMHTQYTSVRAKRDLQYSTGECIVAA